jgi:4a-hydroxytetrahydrobiopterin dehydratase
MTPAQIAELVGVGGWDYAPGSNAIQKSYEFQTFIDATGFIVKGALLAEKCNHHPDWACSSNVVKVNLTTHDAGGVTMRDCDFAMALDEIADSHSRLDAAVRSLLASRMRS